MSRLTLVLGLGLLMPVAATAQPLDMSKGGPVTITSRDGIDWQQAEKVVIARGDAKAVRDNVTVTADRLIAHYRAKVPTPGATSVKPGATPVAAKVEAPAKPGDPVASPIDTDSGGNEIYRLEADGNVHIFTATDVAVGDHATYDMDQAVLLLTGKNLKITRPAQVITARDTLEYWSQLHRSVARGNAVVVTSDARRLAADTLVAYSAPPKADAPPISGQPSPVPTPSKDGADPLAASGKIEKVEAFGNVSVRTQTDTVTGDRGVYVPDTGIARIGGNVRITRGQNQLNGQEAEVDMKTGLSRLTAGTQGQVHGLVMPNDASAQTAPGAPKTAAPGKPKPVKDKPQ